MAYDVQRVIAAYQAGRNIRDRKEAQLRELEDRDYELKQRQAQFKLDQINQEMAKRKLEQENLQAMQGMPGPSVSTPAPSPFGVRGATSAPVGSQLPGQQGIELPTPQGAQSQTLDLPLPSMQISGVPSLGVAGYSARPTSAQEMLRAKRDADMQAALAKAQEPFTLPQGNIRVIPGTGQVFDNPMPEKPEPRPAFQRAEIADPANPAQPKFANYDSKAGKYYDSDTGAEIKGARPYKAPKEDGGGKPDALTLLQRTNQLDEIVTGFQKDEFVKQAVKGSGVKRMADQIIANPGKATAQLAALYLYVKNLDPDSAVREGELALAQQTMSFRERFATSLTRLAKGQVLSPEAAKALAQASKELISAWEETAKVRQRDYESRADVAGVGEGFNKFLVGRGSTPTGGGLGGGLDAALDKAFGRPKGK